MPSLYKLSFALGVRRNAEIYIGAIPSCNTIKTTVKRQSNMEGFDGQVMLFIATLLNPFT